MDNNLYNDESNELKQQEFFPGPFPGGPGQGPGSQQGRPPSGPPPSFEPEMPRGQLSGEPMPLGRGMDSRRQPTGIRQCLNRFTFVWLIGGGAFWFYPTSVRRNVVEGFRWRRNCWEYDRINLSRIIFFSCF